MESNLSSVPPVMPRPRPEIIGRSEEHTSELQSLRHLVCRLLLEKKRTFGFRSPRAQRRRAKPNPHHTRQRRRRGLRCVQHRSRVAVRVLSLQFFFFFFNDTATTEIYTLSLHDALPISGETANRCASCLHSWRGRDCPEP